MEQESIRQVQDLVNQAARCYGERIFLRYLEKKEIREKTFQEVKEESSAIGQLLLSEFPKRRVHCGIIGRTSCEYIEAYLGTVMSGNVIVPLDAKLPLTDACTLLNQADCEVLFYDNNRMEFLPEIKKLCPQINCFIELESSALKNRIGKLSQSFSGELDCQLNESDLAAIFFTSGTTGRNKGVMITHHMIVVNAFAKEYRHSEEDVILSLLPIHHMYCVMLDLFISIRSGNKLCINDAMIHLSKNIRRFQPTKMMMVPVIIEEFYKKLKREEKANTGTPDVIKEKIFGKNLNFIYSGGAKLNTELVRGYERFGITIGESYGMTESFLISTGTREQIWSGSVGMPIGGMNVRIAPDGEICLKGDSVMIGYYNNPEQTQQVLNPEGWFATGDLGCFGQDGTLHITGRKKNLIILNNGENIVPEEIELKFKKEEVVEEVVITSFENSKLAAVIYPNLEWCRQNEIDAVYEQLQSVTERINESLPSFKRIQKIVMRDKEFPKTASGKIIRNQEYC